MPSIAVIATGMVTGAGLSAAASCAAMRCAIDNFRETRFVDGEGEFIVGSEVPLDPPSRGRERLVRMAAAAIAECLPALERIPPRDVPLLLCMAEADRPGRTEGIDDELLADVSAEVGARFSDASILIANGRVGGAEAVLRARQLVEAGYPACLVAGADSFLVAGTLTACEQKNRLLTSQNSNGFIPGEAGSAALLARARQNGAAQLVCRGIGFGRERATIESEEPLRSDGMADAFRAAMADGRCTFDAVDYRLTDISGEQYAFKDAALGLSRTMRKLKPEFRLWHPADCIGEVGAAIVPIVLAVAKAAAEKGYAPGKGVLCHFANDDGARAAMVLSYISEGVA
jgi:3-oxoacyl-[acyl-carrier-protein] synthase I